jgi:CHAD domain-containing protein
MADGKWIAELTPRMPLPEAAERVLRVRLETVQHHFAGVLEHAADDPEHVHQLRVSTRRADAALRLFRTCLPRRVYKAARQRLRGLRRAAGEARDWDVFALELEERRRVPATQRQGIDFLIGYAQGQRDAAQHPLDAEVQAQQGDYETFLELLLDEVRPSEELGDEASLLDLARQTLVRREQALEEAASADLADYASLHRVRIAGKKLRYAMEVFADCFGPEFRATLYPRVEEMQEILGRANDSHVAAQRLTALRERLQAGPTGLWKQLRPGVEAILQFHTRRLPQERRRFGQWWKAWTARGKDEFLACLGAGPVEVAAEEQDAKV